jgi:hypothetical protein
MWVRMRKGSMHFDIQSERFFLVQRSSLGHLKAVLHRILSDQRIFSQADGTDLRGVQNLLDFFEDFSVLDLASLRRFKLLLYQDLDVP